MAIKFFAFFFSDNQYFRMFLVSMADIIGSYERLPNDAVRAVAVAKRREYLDESADQISGSTTSLEMASIIIKRPEVHPLRSCC